MFYLDIWNLIISQLDVVSVFRLAATCTTLHEHIWKSYNFSVNDYYIWRCAIANRCVGTLSKLLTLAQYQWPVSDGLIYAMLFDDSETFDLLLEVTPVQDIHLSLAIGLDDAALLKVLLDNCDEDHPLWAEHILHAEEAKVNNGVVDVIRDSRCYRSLKCNANMVNLASFPQFPRFSEVSLIAMGPGNFFHALRSRDLIRLPLCLASCREYSYSFETADTLLGHLSYYRPAKPVRQSRWYDTLSEEEAEFLRLICELHADIRLKWPRRYEEEKNPRAYIKCGFNEYGIYDYGQRELYRSAVRLGITDVISNTWTYYDTRRDASSPLKPLPEYSSDWEDDCYNLKEAIRVTALCDWKLYNKEWTNSLRSQELEYWEAVTCDVARCYSVLARD